MTGSPGVLGSTRSRAPVTGGVTGNVTLFERAIDQAAKSDVLAERLGALYLKRGTRYASDLSKEVRQAVA